MKVLGLRNHLGHYMRCKGLAGTLNVAARKFVVGVYVYAEL